MKMIILCGGLGTRLRSVIGEKQKTMAYVKGQPFLKIVIDQYKKYNINEFVFACGYKKEEIQDYFKDGKDFGIKCQYAIESLPLGTGGAIRNCLDLINDDLVFVINGDTLTDFNINILYDNLKHFNSDMSIYCKFVDDYTRYGSIKYTNYDNQYGGIITEFNEKVDDCFKMNICKDNKLTLVNGGMYLIKKDLIETIPFAKCSLEYDLIPQWLKENRIISFVNSYNEFIDIGTEESYNRINT